MSVLRRFLACESGATAIEYSLIAGIIGLGILTGAQTLHNAIEAKYVATSAGVANIGN
jgi:pilus assembly protein Flp/PilA